MYRFTIVRPDRAVIVRAGSFEQLADRLRRWTALESRLCGEVALRAWLGWVVCVQDHAVLRGEVDT